MEMRVEQLSVRSGVPVDTVRYYQSKGLLAPPRRQGRVAWYDDGHLERLARIRSLQQRGFTLATIVRLVDGELDAADEALIGELSGLGPTGGPTADPPARARPRDRRRRPPATTPAGAAATRRRGAGQSGRVRSGGGGASPSPSWPARPGCRWPS